MERKLLVTYFDGLLVCTQVNLLRYTAGGEWIGPWLSQGRDHSRNRQPHAIGHLCGLKYIWASGSVTIAKCVFISDLRSEYLPGAKARNLYMFVAL
jgi:hypothetical protein